ncbi:nineteen complex-related protein 2-domain-containing protein [Phellopilus nigrolimitatus]|nr:nineteen complex-related protein 2-domain-containing protein [Phellopilus nigrolimitatus]
MSDHTFIKRSKSRTTRARARQSQPGAVEASPSTLVAKLKKQRAKPKAPLSFGDDGEGDGEVFHVKKSNLSRKLKLGPSSSPGITLPSNLDQASISSQSSGVVYSKEYLSELKASTQSAPTNLPPVGNYESDMALDANEIDGAVIVDQEMTAESASEIPAESSILAAKQKRERLRQTNPSTGQGEDEFISLAVTRKDDTYQGPHPESRLMREDDELGEGDDEFAEYTAAHERIALGKKSKKKEAASRRCSEEHDEETMEWEMEQLRRGSRRDSESSEKQKPKQEYRPAPIPPLTPLPTLDSAISRLTQSMTQLTTSHASNTTSMSSFADERTVLEGKEKEMRTMVENAELKRSWFSSFREWVETVATFLDEKYPTLEELEEEHVSLLKERSNMVAKRRIQDDEDDLSLFLGDLPPSGTNDQEELDELGRVLPRQNPAVARKERRAYRTSRHARHTASQEEEGYSTDSSLFPSDEADYQAALSSLHSKVNNVLQDVRSDEFQDPQIGVARWFGGWREKYSDTYTGAFGGLGMVSAWEFWVRLELLGWDPVADPRALDSFAWFSALYEYSRPRNEDAEPALGPDGDLVSAMISTAVVPRLCKVIQSGAFDPYSARHILILVDLAEQVEASATQDKFELLLKSIATSFRQAVESTLATLQPYIDRQHSAKFDPEAIPARRRFLVRRYKLTNNIARWRKYSGEKFGIGELISKLTSDCIYPVAESGWEVGGEEIMQKARIRYLRQVTKVIPPELNQSKPSSSKL